MSTSTTLEPQTAKWISEVAERFLCYNLGSPNCLPAFNNCRLSAWIACALRRAEASEDDLFGALFLLQRYICAFPHVRFPEGSFIFAACFMLAHKSLNDGSFLNKDWIKFFGMCESDLIMKGQNQLERAFCSALGYNLVIRDPQFSQFKWRVVADYGQDRVSYPRYPACLVMKPDPGVDGSQSVGPQSSAPHAQSWLAPAWAPSTDHHSAANGIPYGVYKAYGNASNSHLV